MFSKEVSLSPWYQRESETSLENIEPYHPRMDALLKALRNDLRQPDLPFYYVQIGCYVSRDADANNWNSIREAQRTWSALQTRPAMDSAIDLQLDDAITVGTCDLNRLE